MNEEEAKISNNSQLLNLKRIIEKISSNKDNQESISKAKRYYANENDVLTEGALSSVSIDPLRSADNRIPHNFHEVMVDEKVSYLLSYPVLIDIDNNKEINESVLKILGSDYERKMKNQGIEASNAGTSWVHYWYQSKDDKKDSQLPVKDKFEFKYALVPSEQIIPIYSNGLERDLEGVIRYYATSEYTDDSDKLQKFSYIEYWTKTDAKIWKFKDEQFKTINYEELIEFSHVLGEVPFIEFANNMKKQSDLDKYLHLIDLYDRVFSGFANDLDDIQEIIYILENYGGQDLAEFKQDLKEFKAVKVDSMDGSKGDVRTLKIDIPVEARKTILELLKKQIYESGQALQQEQETFGSSSGIALKFFYRKLELKAGAMETEFRSGLARLIKAILKYLGIENYNKITQTWTRNMISNDSDAMEIINKSIGLLDETTLIENHPFVDDVEKVLERKRKEEARLYESDYPVLVNSNGEDELQENKLLNNLENKE